MIDRVKRIKEKGFNMMTDFKAEAPAEIDFSKIKVGAQVLQDAILEDIGTYKRNNPRMANIENILKAIKENNYELMRDISNYFYKTSGIYSRLCRYMAYLYRYD